MIYKSLKSSQDPLKASKDDGFAVYKPQVRSCATLFFGKKFKIRKKILYFFQKGSKTEKWLFFDLKITSKWLKMMFFVYKRVLGLLNHCFDRLDQKKMKNWSYLSYSRIFISKESMFHARSTSNIKKNGQKSTHVDSFCYINLPWVL